MLRFLTTIAKRSLLSLEVRKRMWLSIYLIPGQLICFRLDSRNSRTSWL